MNKESFQPIAQNAFLLSGALAQPTSQEIMRNVDTSPWQVDQTLMNNALGLGQEEVINRENPRREGQRPRPDQRVFDNTTDPVLRSSLAREYVMNLRNHLGIEPEISEQIDLDDGQVQQQNQPDQNQDPESNVVMILRRIQRIVDALVQQPGGGPGDPDPGNDRGDRMPIENLFKLLGWLYGLFKSKDDPPEGDPEPESKRKTQRQKDDLKVVNQIVEESKIINDAIEKNLDLAQSIPQRCYVRTYRDEDGQVQTEVVCKSYNRKRKYQI